MKQLPWIEYDGQTTSELLACKKTHRIDSILCAFEWGIQAKARLSSEYQLTDEERLILALMALDREVNNGGYHQFFVNSSRRFVTIIVSCLRRIECETTALLTERAITSLGISEVTEDTVADVIFKKNAPRDAILNECDNAYYKVEEIGTKLFPFIEAHQSQIQLVRGTQPPIKPVRHKRSNAAKLSTYLSFKKTDPSLENLRLVAREVAKERDIPATDQDIEAAAVMNVFERSLTSGDMEAAERSAIPALEMMREDTWHSVLHKKWVKKLIEAGRFELADTTTFVYLEFLKSSDQSMVSTQNRILFWAAPLQEHRAALPRSVEFFVANFPNVDLAKPLPRQRFAVTES